MGVLPLGCWRKRRRVGGPGAPFWEVACGAVARSRGEAGACLGWQPGNVVCACACGCMRECTRACACACVQCMHACTHACVRVSKCMRPCVCECT
eukprot:15474394-Alexandrium_andersonii.AAC.1